MLRVDLNKIKLLRKKRMSLEEMSLKLGYGSPNGYYYLESGRSKIPADILAQVSTILEVPIQELFYDDEIAAKK
jgi:Helix-turn-helix.